MYVALKSLTLKSFSIMLSNFGNQNDSTFPTFWKNVLWKLQIFLSIYCQDTVLLNPLSRPCRYLSNHKIKDWKIPTWIFDVFLQLWCLIRREFESYWKLNNRLRPLLTEFPKLILTSLNWKYELRAVPDRERNIFLQCIMVSFWFSHNKSLDLKCICLICHSAFFLFFCNE